MALSNGRDTNRAQIFEDEKRRIIDSCFNKRDEDGSILETYITHLRMIEYSSHPTTPPPPQARTPQSEKPRVIIVAVRKSGRVRMHKSKENPNGTYSIGKTWNLDDLTSIESFTSPTANRDYREWAGDVGFTVTIGKPYYWQAQTDKEKKFFIASLIKIYGKYTGGRSPELSGFDQRELEQVQGGAQRRLQQNAASRPAPLESAPGGLSGDTLSVSSGYNGSAGGLTSPSSLQQTISSPRNQGMANGGSSPAGSIDSGRGQNVNALRRLAGTNKSQDSVANSTTTRSDDGAGLRPRSRNGINGGAYGSVPDLPSTDDRPPERKRPPMDPLRPQVADRDLVPAPLMSPGMRREPGIPPRSLDRASTRKESSSLRSETTSLSDKTVTAGDATRIDASGAWSKSANGTPAPDNSAVTQPPPLPTDALPAESPIEPEESRPGLGPMIKKKSKADIAGAFRRAAAAANAFKPRPGGAGDRLRQLQSKSNEPDGITSVVPAPPREEPKPQVEQVKETVKVVEQTPGIPEVKITLLPSSRPESLQTSAKEVQKEIQKAPEPEDEMDKDPRRSIVAGNDVKYLTTLGVDPTLLDNRTVELTKMLDYFGWVPGEQMRARSFEEIKADIDRELSRAQAGGWLARFREEDERVDAIKKGIDVAINECDELDNLLTLYSVELSTLSDDIAYIEAQGQGLQVQAANQKLLRKELESLLATCAITDSDLEALRIAPLETASGIEQIESALVTLFKAMSKIDPAMGGSEPRKSEEESNDASGFNSDFGKMRIVQEKKEMYTAESLAFMRRLVGFMATQFDEAFRETKRVLDGALTKKVDSHNHDVGRNLLWKYSPLILYARDVDLDNWNRIVQIYQDKGHPVYKSEFRDALEAWKRFVRKPTGEEAELLFTHQQEKQQEGIATTARKLTVKRSQTLARGLRGTLGDGSKTSLDKSSDSRSLPYEVFTSVLDDLLPLVEMEQNFIVDFFHATTLEQIDFPDAVGSSRPQDRRGGDLRRHRLMEPDRELARRVTRSMEVIFAFLEQDLQNLVDWVLSHDPLQGIGVMATLERKMVDVSQSNQDFLNSILQKLHGNLEGRFKKFVDEQIRAIEETKVKINKRKGVISFVRTFPAFSTAVEAMLVGVDPNLSVRHTVDHEYNRILKSMFESLKVIARENPAVGIGGAVATGGANSADPEDKEALNFHILLIENTNHYLEEVQVDNASRAAGTGNIGVLDDWRQTAAEEFASHMELYLNAVMRRPLGRLLETLENIQAQLDNGKSPAAVAAQPSNSKAIFNKVLGGYDAREVRKGIETLRRRVEKHFGDADDPGLSRGLVAKVLAECEKFYGKVEMRIARITTEVYGGDVLFEWPRAEVKSAFAAGTR